jgi:peptidoglycan/xylan/chitin deacetylase (PgdA/CDA1 family)
MIDKDGKTQTGAYDIVPILENFIKSHRDFSYKGARAVLALTGVEGVFGYRTAPTYSDYTQQTEAAKKVIAAVKAAGYELACYSYENKAYDSRSPEQIKAELELWKKEVTPLLGEISLFVMCKGSDIAPKGSAYSGAKFQVLKTYGFTDFIGFSDDGKNWFNSYADHNRMGRIMITGANLSSHASWFEGIFDAYAIKDRLRN